MRKCLYVLLMLSVMWSMVYGRGLRDRLEGLVFEAEEWSEPKDGWQLNKSSDTKWNLWTTEDDVWNKRSNGASLQSPYIKKERKSPEEGAPALHTKITGIPNGFYSVFLGFTTRPLGYSLDGGKTWKSTGGGGEHSLGFFNIKNGIFEIWIDDRYECKDNLGWAYYDYIRMVKVDEPRIYDVASFTLPDGKTQISWITSVPMPRARIVYGTNGKLDKAVEEEFDGMRNHVAVLDGLTAGAKYGYAVEYGISGGDVFSSDAKEFVAGRRPVLKASKPVMVALSINEPSGFGRKSWPVCSGVPFAQGVLASAEDARIVDAGGKVLPATLEVSSRWSDGSVRWLTCEFFADTKPGGKTAYFVKTGAGQGTAPAAESSFRGNFTKEKLVECSRNADLRIVLEDGTELAKGDTTVASWESTPTHVEAVIDTLYSAKGSSAQFALRLMTTVYLPEDSAPIVRRRVSLTNCDMSVEMAKIRFISGGFVKSWKGGEVFKLALSNGKEFPSDAVFTQYLPGKGQASAGGKVYDLGNVDGVFTLIGADDGAMKNDVPLGTVWMKDFWQSYPKGFSFGNGAAVSHILPELPKAGYPPGDWNTNPSEFFEHFYWYSNGCYNFKRGMEIQQEIWHAVYEADMGAVPEQYAAWLPKPLFAIAEPQYYCDSKAFGDIDPVSPDLFPEDWEAFKTSYANHLKGRDQRGEYGWMNYGDWFGERGWNWGNNEYDMTYMLGLCFARSGEFEYLDRADQMARHYTTVDMQHIKHYPSQREIVYAHSTGHVGGHIKKDDSLFKSLGKTQANPNGGQDGSGGHSHQAGNFLMGCLMGNRHFFDMAEQVCWNQATWYTPAYRIYIERAVGWAIVNAVNAYNYTNNPYYLNAAKIYFEAIRSTQNPETGCFDLHQDQSECECPDKQQHRGGKAFATGVLLHGLIRLYEITGEEDVKTSLVRCVDWLLDYSWNENAKGFRYKTGCPKYANSGWYAILTIEGIAYASKVTGNMRYADFLERTAGVPLRKVTGSKPSSGKDFAMRFRQTPHALYHLRRLKNIKSTNVLGVSSHVDKNGFFLDKDRKASVSIMFNMVDLKTLKCKIDVVSTDNLTVENKSITWTLDKQGRYPSPAIRIKDGKPGGSLTLSLTYGGRTRKMTMKAYSLPAEPKLGKRVVFFGGDKNFTAVAFKELGFTPEFLSDINKADLSGCKAVIVGSDSMGVSTPVMSFESAAKLLSFANGGGKVVFMQVNDTSWDTDFMGEFLSMNEPNSVSGGILQPAHPLFAGIDSKKFAGVNCYDTITWVSPKWQVLAQDEGKRPCIALLKQGKGEILFVLPSFDRFHVKGEQMDVETGRRFVKNIIDYVE